MDVDIAQLERFRDALPSQLAATKELAQFIIENPAPPNPSTDDQWRMLTGTVGNLLSAHMELAAHVADLLRVVKPA